MSTEDEVRAASDRFYSALNRVVNGDAGPMAGVWSQSADVTTLHPLGGREVGWIEVAGGFAEVARLATGGRVEVSNQLIMVGTDLAYEVADERGEAVLGGERVAIGHRVTNIYRRGPTGWKIVHHHTDVSTAMVTLLERLNAKR